MVTGGGGVLGRAFAEALSSCSAKTVILNRTKEKADEVVHRLRAAGGTALSVSADVLDVASLRQARETILAEFGPCDILINAAGGNHPKGTTSKEYLLAEDLVGGDSQVTSFFDLDPKGVGFVFDLNFLGTLLPTQVFAKDMVGKAGATVVNISSMGAYAPLTKVPAYSAAKAAVSNFTQWLSVHMSKVGIRVNAIAPGFFLTSQNEALLTNPDGSYTDRAHKILSHTPMGRFGDPQELVGTLLWLVDENASGFVNGTVIPVDGGFAAYSGV